MNHRKQTRKLQNGKSSQVYKVKSINYRTGSEVEHEGTIERLNTEVFGYVLEVGASWQHEKGNHAINQHPKTIKSLINNLNWSASNSVANDSPARYYVLA